MKTKSALLTCLGLLSAMGMSHAAVTISFNSPYIGGMSANLANASGTVSNGLIWGVIVDGTGNGFTGSYDAMADGAALMSSSVATDDFLYLSTTPTNDSSQGGALLEGDFTTPGGDGGIGTIAFSFTGSVTTGDTFRVVWFDNGKVGTLADASFVIPADGAIVTYDAPFVGSDPARSASSSYAGTSATPTGAGFTVVPEPSALLLGAVGALGLLRRRRM